jgi:5-methylcytosine-specific restriction endonuclease McrA
MKTAICQQCSSTFDYHPYAKTGTYCSNRCSGNAKRERSRVKFLKGVAMDRATQRSFVIERDGYQCKECGITTWLGEPAPLELDHIDGNAANNDPTNLRMLCCNCHSQTPFYGGKNKGSGRKARGLPTR